MLGKKLGQIVAEVVRAPIEATDQFVRELTEECRCLRHKVDPDCPRHGRR